MKRNESAPDNVTGSPDRLDTVIEWLLGALLVFMPLAFGVVQGWSKEVVIGLSGAIVICFLLKLVFNTAQKPLWTWAYVPIGLFLLTAVFQLLPLPTWLVSIISPNTAAVKTHLLGDLPDADVELGSMTLSFYSNATIHDLRLALAVAGVFVVVFNIFRQPRQIKRLLMVIAVTGGFVAAIALAQGLFGNGKIYWFVFSRYSRGYSGPFVNHSHYGQFMNLSIGAALGLLMVKLREVFSGKTVILPDVFEYLISRSARQVWLLVAVIGIGAATVFISLSRGGMISLLIAAAFTTVLVASKRSTAGGGWIMVATALIAFSCVLYTGFDAVHDRLATVLNLHEAQGRLQILKDIATAWTRFPMLGTGLGTHSVVYPMFDRSNITALAAYAENEYAQVLEETGIVGLGLWIIFGIIVWSKYAKTVRIGRPPVRLAAYGLGFGILAILIHSASDFGQHLPANAFLSAIFCALLLVLARPKEPGNNVTEISAPSRWFFFLRLVVLFVVCGILAWAFVGANNQRIAEARWDKGSAIEKNLVNKNWRGTDAEYAELISHAAAASTREPGNIKYRYWLNVYRWHSVSRRTDTDVNVVVPESSIPFVRDIVDQFHQARRVCPTYGPTYSVVGQIEKFILKDELGSQRIRKGYQLAPCDPIACFIAGYLDILEGRVEDCIAKLEKAVQLDGGLFQHVADIYVNHLSRPDLAMSAARDDIARLSYVACLFAEMQYDDFAEQARERIKNLLETQCSRPDAPASAFASLASIYEQQQDNETAIQCYRRALSLDYGQVYWRLELVKLLAQTHRIQEAMREASICLRLHPELPAVRELLADLSIRPATLGKETRSP